MGNCTRAVLLAVVVQGLLVPTLWGRTMYVTDTREIMMRSEKEIVGRNILKVLSSGTPVEVLDLGESWATIQLGDDRTGYVLKRFLISRLPHKVVAERLQTEVEQLRERLDTSEQKLATLEENHQRIQRQSIGQETQLTDVTQKYAQLQQDAAQYLQLKADYGALQATHDTAVQRLTTLNDDYLLLKNSHNIGWFLSGGGVLLAGWIIGMITERFRGRRRRQSSHTYQLPS